MTKKPANISTTVETKPKTSGQKIANKPESTPPRPFWPWLAALLILGLLLLGSISYVTENWLSHLSFLTSPSVQQQRITTLNIHRTLIYADLTITVVNAQYAASFSDDEIQAGPALARLNMQVSNKTPDAISVVYYEVARLLIPKQAPIAPTNVQLATTYSPGASATGWIDFPIVRDLQLSTLKLQLGSTALNETRVLLPFSGSFNPTLYADRISQQSLTISYSFRGYALTYHLNSIDIRYSYKGTQVKAGRQFYVLNLSVDNPNGVDVSPGLGFDYIRLVINGNNLPPIDNTLPYGFKAGSHGIGGRVVYMAQAGMKSLTIGFLLQLVQGQHNYPVNV